MIAGLNALRKSDVSIEVNNRQGVAKLLTNITSASTPRAGKNFSRTAEYPNAINAKTGATTLRMESMRRRGLGRVRRPDTLKAGTSRQRASAGVGKPNPTLKKLAAR